MAEHANQSTCENDECTVSKRQLLRFIEAKFQTADRDQDGVLMSPNSAIFFDLSRTPIYGLCAPGTASAKC